MATLTITSWTITPLNPDGTDNTNLPTLTGSVPTSDIIDWAAMGQNIRLELTCDFAGTYTDTTTANVSATLIRYNPGFFVDAFSQFYPPLSFPTGGYSYTVPNTTPAVYQMALAGQYENTSNNENGDVFLEVISATQFIITHEFRMTSSLEGYVIGRKNQNQYRLSKVSQYADTEADISRPAGYGNLKAINAYLGSRQRNYTLIAPELSIQTQASAFGFDSDGNVNPITGEITIARVATPSTIETSLSPFEDNLITFNFEDPSTLITADEVVVLFTSRKLIQNIGAFTRDLAIHEVKLVSSAGSAQLSGPIYEPVTYAHVGTVTSVSFVLKGTLLEDLVNYQIHALAEIDSGPSDIVIQHYMGGLMRTDGAPMEVDFTMMNEIWTRNAKHAEDFTITVNERATSVLTMNRTEYDADVASPFTSFANDIDTVTIRVYDEDAEIVFSSFVQKALDGTFADAEFIGNDYDIDPSSGDDVHFYLKEFRVPFENFQDLENWDGKTYTFKWSVLFKDQLQPEFGAVYNIDALLNVRGYENTEPSPSADYVSNIRFLDPSTGLPISNWCDLTSVLVMADVEDLGLDTYVDVMIDKYPLGVAIFNDYALQEEDPAIHTLPDYVIFSQKVSALISELDDQPTDGVISFLVDISDLTDLEKYRIFVHVYRVDP